MIMWLGELTDAYAAQDLPAPAQFGLPTDDDGPRDDPLLSDASAPVTAYEPDLDVLRAESSRIVLAVGEETGQSITARTTLALAALLGEEAVVFPGGHGGFATENPDAPGDPAAFARRLRAVLADRA